MNQIITAAVEAKHLESTAPLVATIAQWQACADLGLDLECPVSGDLIAQVRRSLATQKAARAEFMRTSCPRCAGTGVWKGPWWSGVCFQCGGDGKRHQ